MASQLIYDALIIGAGPAGLSVATALARTCRRITVFDSQEYRNEGVKEMHNVIGHEGQNPEAFRKSAIEDIMKTYDTVSLINTKITTAKVISDDDDNVNGFEIANAHGGSYRGKKLVLATGSRDVPPEIPGYKELWANGIVHCLFCHGYEHKGTPAGVLGLESLQHISPTLIAYTVSNSDITIFSNGAEPTQSTNQESLRIALARGCKLDTRKIERLSRGTGEHAVKIHFDDGSNRSLGFLMHTPPAVNRAADIIAALGVQLAGEGMHVQSQDVLGETNIRGCFVAGDTGTMIKAVSTAISSGATAGAGVAMQLAYDEGLEAVRAENAN